MKIVDNSIPSSPRSISFDDIPEGTVFRCKGLDNGLADGHVFLRVYGHIVSLTKPVNTWTESVGVIRNYVPLNAHVVIEGEL